MSLINRNSGSPIFNTLAEAQASNMGVGQLPIVLGTSGAFDGGGIIYSVQPNGSGGLSMSNGNELVKYTGTAAVLDVMTDLSDPASGSLMPPGAFGIGLDDTETGSIPILTTVDTNSLLTGALYRSSGSTAGTKPFTNFNLIVFRINALYTRQIAFEYATGAIAQRTVQDGVYPATWKRIDPQAFGLGGNVVNVSNSDWNDITVTGFYVGLNMVNAPPKLSGASGWAYVFHKQGFANFATQQAFNLDDSNGGVVQYQRTLDNGTWTDWQELYHTGNLNTLEFGGVAANDIVASGWASSSTEAFFQLPIGMFANPSSITVTGTFGIGNQAGVVIFSGKTPVASAVSSNKVCIASISGLAGLTAGQILTLVTEGVTSKITVNP